MAGVNDWPVIDINPSRHSITTHEKDQTTLNKVNSYFDHDNNADISPQLDYHLDINGQSIESFFNNLEKEGSPAFKLDLSLELGLEYKYEEIPVPSKREISGFNVRYQKKVEYNEKNVTAITSGANKKRVQHIQYFYRQTEKISYSINREFNSDFLRVRDKIKAKYLYDLSIDFSFLTKFVKQSNILSNQNKDIFPDYLNITDKLINKSLKIADEFFDRVDDVLENAMERFGTTISAFLAKLKTGFGLNDEQLNKLKDNIIGEVGGFFDRLSGYFKKVEAKLESTDNVQTEVQGGTEDQVADSSNKIPTQ